MNFFILFNLKMKKIASFIYDVFCFNNLFIIKECQENFFMF